MAELENKRIKELKANLLKEDNEYRFHPKINENADEILEESKKMRRMRRNYKDDKSLLNYKELLENKRKKLKEKKRRKLSPTFNIKIKKIYQEKKE